MIETGKTRYLQSLRHSRIISLEYVYDYLSEDEYLGLQSFLLQYPEVGKIVRGSGGVRKIRWAIAGKGKSGGVRVIYYFKKKRG